MTSKTKYNSLKDYIKLHLNLNETNKNNELEIRFGTNNSERSRVDASGNFLVGKTAADFTVAGHEIRNGSYAGFTRAGLPLLANRLSSDGDIIEFYKNTASII